MELSWHEWAKPGQPNREHAAQLQMCSCSTGPFAYMCARRSSEYVRKANVMLEQSLRASNGAPEGMCVKVCVGGCCVLWCLDLAWIQGSTIDDVGIVSARALHAGKPTTECGAALSSDSMQAMRVCRMHLCHAMR